MKSIVAFAVIGLIAAGYAGSASANHFKPKGVQFKATGSFTVFQNIGVVCKAVLRGDTIGQGTNITSASFTGSACDLTANALPWRMTTGAPDSLTIHGMAVQGTFIGCAGDVKARLSSLGQIIFSTNLGVCGLIGTLVTRPQLKSVGK